MSRNLNDTGVHAVKQFLARFADEITGILNGFDRVVFRGTLIPLVRERSFHTSRRRAEVRLLDFKAFVLSVSERVEEMALAEAVRAERSVRYLESASFSKEDLARVGDGSAPGSWTRRPEARDPGVHGRPGRRQTRSGTPGPRSKDARSGSHPPATAPAAPHIPAPFPTARGSATELRHRRGRVLDSRALFAEFLARSGLGRTSRVERAERLRTLASLRALDLPVAIVELGAGVGALSDAAELTCDGERFHAVLLYGGIVACPTTRRTSSSAVPDRGFAQQVELPPHP